MPAGTFSGEIDKLKRGELYGWSEIKAFDEDGNECEIVSVADDGKTLFGKGGYNFATVNDRGDFVKTEDLIAVDLNNEPLEIAASSFDSGIDLTETATVEEFLSHQVKSVYHLVSDDIPAKFLKSLAGGQIYKFNFSYRQGTNIDQGFLLANKEGVPFIILTTASEVNFLGFQDVSATEDLEDEAETDLFDFGAL